jgi:hypothetical protein
MEKYNNFKIKKEFFFLNFFFLFFVNVEIDLG